MRCTCPDAEGSHHHAFGGTYPCLLPERCKRCADYDAAVWGDQPLPAASRSSFRAARQRRIPRES
jgi:hypothetical protein